MAEPGTIAPAPPTPPDSAASAPMPQPGTGSAAKAAGAAKPKVSRGYSAEIKALDDTVNKDLSEIKDEMARNLKWGTKFYVDHFEPKTGKWDKPIFQSAFDSQRKEEVDLSNKLNEDLKKDMRARLGTPGLGPGFEKRVREIAAHMSQQFGIKAAAERDSTEIINEAYKPFDDAIEKTYDVYMDNLLKPEDWEVYNQDQNRIKLWAPSRETERAERIFHNTVKAAVLARLGSNITLVSAAKVKEIKGNLSAEYESEIDEAIFAIKSERLPLDQRVDALIRRVVSEENAFLRLSQLCIFYPSESDKFREELSKNNGYKKIVKDFVMQECFHDPNSQPRKVDAVMTVPRKVATWIIIPEIATDVLRAAEKYAQENHIALPTEKIKALYDKIDTDARIKAVDGMP
jgi:hypothetical protein